jgi:LysR family transcriptional regulator, nitrogen assimilation regulatory protein
VEIRQLEYFVEIARQRGFSRAAAHLYIAQSALSRQISLLEQELGVALLLRTGRGVQLTEAGEVFLARAESIIRQCRQIRQEVAPANAPGGELSIGMPPSLSATLAAPLLSGLRERFPLIFVDAWIETSILLREFVIRGKLDIAVLGLAESESVLNTQALVTEDLFLVGSGAARLDPDNVVSIAEAAATPLILTSRPNSIRVLVESALKQHGVPKIVMEVNSVPLLLELVEAQIGHTILPYSAIQASLHKQLLTASRLADLSLDWVIATSRERPLSAGAVRAQELMRQIVDEAIATGRWPYARGPRA